MIDSATLLLLQRTIDHLDHIGVGYRVEGGKFLVRPLKKLSAADRQNLRPLKPALIEYLTAGRVDDRVIDDVPSPVVEDLIDPDDIPVCPHCGLMEAWQSVLGRWHCERCDPPKCKWTVDEVLEMRNKILGNAD